MPFFARPDLSNEQFKQLPNGLLSLSGQTRIATVSGLTLHDSTPSATYPEIVITADGAMSHVGDVLTYDGVGRIKLLPSGAGGDPIYPATYKSPASVNLCGITQGFELTGKTLACILQTLLVPTLNPTVVAPSMTSLSISPSTTLYEVGTIIPALGINSTFSRGSVSPAYCGGPSVRSGAANGYNYIYFGVPAVSPTSSYTVPLPQTIGLGSNNISGNVSYDAGQIVKDSIGGTYLSALSAGVSNTLQTVILGVYPWFWGKSTTPPVAGQALIASGIKVVADSSGNIVVNDYAATGQYIWIAVPTASTLKTKWQGGNSAENKGNIPAAGGLFASTPTDVVISSPAGSSWGTTVSYKFYISSYATSVNGYTMTFNNI